MVQILRPRNIHASPTDIADMDGVPKAHHDPKRMHSVRNLRMGFLRFTMFPNPCTL